MTYLPTTPTRPYTRLEITWCAGMVERMPLTKEEEEFLTPQPVVNDAAFKRMCEVLNLDEDEQRLARIAVSSYEVAKQDIGDGKH